MTHCPITLPNGQVVHSDPEIRSGTALFVRTRASQPLVEHL